MTKSAESLEAGFGDREGATSQGPLAAAKGRGRNEDNTALLEPWRARPVIPADVSAV